MKRMAVALGLAVALTLTAATVFAAPWQGWRGSGGWGMGGAYQRLYNPSTVETISGEIMAIDKVTPVKGMSYGIHLMVKTDKETVSAEPAPIGSSSGSTRSWPRGMRSR